MMGFPQETPGHLERTLKFMERIAPLVDSFGTLGVVIPMPGTLLYETYHARYDFTGWWLREEFVRYPEQPPRFTPEALHRYCCDDASLDLDFFHYSEEMRNLIRGCLRYKAAHNLRGMGIPA
jgi:hypothetical protein